MTKLTHSAGQELRIAHNAAGLIESISDSLDRTNVYQYDTTGHLVEVRDFRGWTTRYAYPSGQGPAAEHALTTVTYPDGTHQYYTYDINGRLGILKVHAKGKPLANMADLETIAKATPGFSGADLANLISELLN